VTAGYESHFANILGAGFHEIAPYLIMILVLLIRPYGLFGTRKVERILTLPQQPGKGQLIPGPSRLGCLGASHAGFRCAWPW
jgi:hypothetical protein